MLTKICHFYQIGKDFKAVLKDLHKDLWTNDIHYSLITKHFPTTQMSNNINYRTWNMMEPCFLEENVKNVFNPAQSYKWSRFLKTVYIKSLGYLYQNV